MANQEQMSQIVELVQNLSVEDRREVARIALGSMLLDDRAEVVGSHIEDFYDHENGYIHPKVFPGIARVVALATYELPTVRVGEDDDLEILLARRVNTSPTITDPWEGQVHVPGVVIRDNDTFPHMDKDNEMAVDFTDFSAPRQRLLKVEGGDALQPIGSLVPMPTVGRVGPRGLEITVRDLLPVKMRKGAELPAGTGWYNIRNILAQPPKGLVLVGSHKRLIYDVSELVGGIAALRHSYRQGLLF